MKKGKVLILALSILLITTGCKVKKDNLDDALIYTTIYPVEYIVEKLYGDNSEVESIYPNGVDLTDYKLKEKQINEYSDSDLFVYIGLSNEKDIAKSFLNKNKDILIIDSTYGLSYTNKAEELWIAPNNFLMLVKNIKASLSEYIDNKYILENIEKNYDVIYQDISWMDAELRTIAKEAISNGTNTIVTQSNVFDYLKNYGFNIISLEQINNNEKNDIKSKFKNGTYSSILKLDTEKDNDFVKELDEENDANVLNINSMITNSDSTSDYKSIQHENINKIRNIVNN